MKMLDLTKIEQMFKSELRHYDHISNSIDPSGEPLIGVSRIGCSHLANILHHASQVFDPTAAPLVRDLANQFNDAFYGSANPGATHDAPDSIS